MSSRLSISVLLFFVFLGLGCQHQPVPERLKTSYAPLNEKLAGMILADEHAISPMEARSLDNPVFLDARETEEYAISHLPGARRIGYDDPNFSILDEVDRSRPLVVYCTVGYRSERMANKLRDRGFSRVYNLYGSIYAWSLAGFPLEDKQGQPTEVVHTYNRKWGSYFPDDKPKTY